MRILFTTPIIEYPAAGGPQLRIENSIKALSMVSDLYVISRNAEFRMGEKEATNFYKKLSKDFSFSPSVQGLSPNRYIRKFQNVSRNIFNSALVRDANRIVDFAQQNNINIIWFGFGNISYKLITLVKKIDPQLKLICDTDSVWSRFVLRELPYEKDEKRKEIIKNEGAKKEKEESIWVDLCDITTAVSEVDADYYRNLTVDKSKVMLFSNVIDMKNYEGNFEKPKEFKEPNIYLAGSFAPQSAMDKAARWFIKDIFPLIKKEIPDIHFYIVGNGSKETLSDIDDRNISILGKLPSVMPYLSNVDVSLVPLKFESGTRFKILEAAACRVPSVSTLLGAEGIPVENNVDIMIADKPREFADAVIKLIKNKEFSKKITDNCFNLIANNNSVESLTVEAKEILKRLGE